MCLVVTVLLAIATTPSARWSDYLVHDGSYRYILQNSYFNLTWHIQGLWADHPLTALNGPIHTLPLESKMYAVLAIVAGLGMLASRKRIVLGCMVLLAVVFMPAPMANTVSRFFTADYGRAAGAMFIAGVAVYGLAGVLRLHLWQGLLLVAGVAVSSGIAYTLCFYLLVIWCLLYVGQLPVSWSWMRPTSDLSYGIYLYGWPSQQVVVSLWPALSPYRLSVLALLLSVGLAALSWRWVESPAVRLGQYLARHKDEQQQTPLAPQIWISLATVSLLLVSTLVVRVIGTELPARSISPMDVRIEDFGPHQSRAGHTFNQQPDGSSAIWLKLDKQPPAGTTIVFDGKSLESSLGERVITAKVPTQLLEKAGDKALRLEWSDGKHARRSPPVTLVITD